MRPRTDHSLRHRDGFPEETKLSQRSDLAETYIRRESKIDDETNESRHTCGDSKPQPPRPEIKADESDNREDEKEYGQVRPLYRTTDLLRCPRVHDRQFSAGDTRYRQRGDGEEQIFPRSPLDPDEQMRQRHGRTRSDHHSPDERNPAHGDEKEKGIARADRLPGVALRIGRLKSTLNIIFEKRSRSTRTTSNPANSNTRGINL